MAAVRLAGMVLAASLGAFFGACGDRSSTVAPPIRAIHRTLPASAVGRDFPFSRNGCIEVPLGPGVGPKSRCASARHKLDSLPRLPDTPVHFIAELPLSRPKSLSQRAFFAVYESRGAGTCFTIVFAIPLDPPTCDGSRRCPSLCLRFFPEGKAFQLGARATGQYTLVAGTVPAAAMAVRLHGPGGGVLTYDLRGPLVKELAGRRVFMADLGKGPKPVRVELVR